MLMTETISREVEARTVEIGRDLFARARAAESAEAGVMQFSLEQWLMQHGMKDEAVKAQLFRFVDVLAVLNSPVSINRHLKE